MVCKLLLVEPFFLKNEMKFEIYTYICIFKKSFITVVVLGVETCNIYIPENKNRAELINILTKMKSYGR